jgi:peptide deformylase
MLLPLAYYGDPVLRQKGARIDKITDEIRQLVKDMTETLHAHNGIGLAAPQIHQSLALFITQVGKLGANDEWIEGKLRVFINPKIISYSQEQTLISEGCLSIPGTYLEIWRPQKVTVEAMDLDGKIFTEEFEDLEAHCVMHENDHINGVLHIDRFRGKDKNKLEQKLREIKKKYRSSPK